jgi:hypothetical protein
MFALGMPLNEVVRVYDLGFRPMPWGDKGFLPAKLQPIGQAPPVTNADEPGSADDNPFASAEKRISESVNQ